MLLWLHSILMATMITTRTTTALARTTRGHRLATYHKWEYT